MMVLGEEEEEQFYTEEELNRAEEEMFMKEGGGAEEAMPEQQQQQQPVSSLVVNVNDNQQQQQQQQQPLVEPAWAPVAKSKAKERWHWAFNRIVQVGAESTFFMRFYRIIRRKKKDLGLFPSYPVSKLVADTAYLGYSSLTFLFHLITVAWSSIHT